jgi:hypothetical protein
VLRLVAAAVLAFSAPALLTPSVLQAQALPNLGGTDGEELSPLMERRLGEQVMNNIRRDRDYVGDPIVLDYLNQAGGVLLSSSSEARGDAGYDFMFFAVRDPSLNAFALPGGFIGVHTGLILASQSESELASVLAHEIGHVSQRHIARMIGNQRQDALLPLAGLLLFFLVRSFHAGTPLQRTRSMVWMGCVLLVGVMTYSAFRPLAAALFVALMWEVALRPGFSVRERLKHSRVPVACFLGIGAATGALLWLSQTPLGLFVSRGTYSLATGIDPLTRLGLTWDSPIWLTLYSKYEVKFIID